MSKIEQIEARGTHYEIGVAVGRRFAQQIRRALENYAFLQERMLPFHHRPEGQGRYQELLRLNRTHYPGYMAELEGLAHGAGWPFEELFLANVRGEYRGYLRNRARGCSDCALLTDQVALIGHNEDGSPAFDGNLTIENTKENELSLSYKYEGYKATCFIDLHTYDTKITYFDKDTDVFKAFVV